MREKIIIFLFVTPFYLIEISRRAGWGEGLGYYFMHAKLYIQPNILGDRTTSATTDRDFALKGFIAIFSSFTFSLFEKFMAISGMLLIPGTGNGERGTGNGERGTGNGERGTGNGEPGTGNGSLGTSVQR